MQIARARLLIALGAGNVVLTPRSLVPPANASWSLYACARVGRLGPRRSQIALLRSWCYCDCRAVAPDVVAAGREMEEAEGVAAAPGPASGLAFRGRRAMSGSWERDQQVEAAQRALVEVLGPYEPLLSRVQAALVWERPARSALWCLGLNAAFW